MSATDRRVIVIGGGAAGLSAAGALKAVGVDAVVLDRDDRVGGTWLRRYDRLHLHTVRRLSGLAHFPIPRRYPKYLSKNEYAEYLQEYVRALGLRVEWKTEVRKVRRAAAGEASGWVVDTNRETWRSRAVIVATGHYRLPVLPVGLDARAYGGEYFHAVEYRNGAPFAGRRALVVGAGNTGTEIATDLAEHGASRVAISIRTPPPVVPRDFLGTPVQVFGVLMSPLPPRLADGIGAVLARIATGDLTRYGLGPPAWRPLTARRIPVIDVGFVAALKRGAVEVRPAVTGFTRDGVIFAGGESEPFDVVIAATGYRTGLERLLEDPGVLDATGFPLHPQGRESSQPGLYFFGYTRSHRGHLFEANRTSRRLAKAVVRALRAG